MKFGVFFELSVARPLTRENESLAIFHALEQVRLADELGFDRAWVVEHHFLEEYSHSSAPELFLTACAMQTQNINLCHGALVCLPGINHPVRIAERTAFLDHLCKGRLEVGTARSSTWTELGGFGLAPDITKASWDEYLRVIPKMWTQDRFSWDGLTFSMPERNVLPKPYQDPHPPLWVTVTSPGTEIEAAQRGIGALGVAAMSFSAQEATVKRYHQAIQNCEPVGSFVTEEVSACNWLYCHEDRNQAVKFGLGMVETFGAMNSSQLWNREVYPSSAYKTLANLAPSKVVNASSYASIADNPGEKRKVPEGLCVGTPDDIIKAIKTWESTGVDSVNFVLNMVEYIPQQAVLDSLRLFASEVMPAFRKTTREAA
jgi:alkanesulfonate monooxygenase SsuD/methylene tetrahydromethanopterin reductase-like flavin-dependent oxidoreductase (luciferase family)